MEVAVILTLLCLLKSDTFTDASFTSVPGDTTGFCEGTNATLTWVYIKPTAISSVQWALNDTINVARLLGTSFIEGAAYSGRLQNDGNGGITIDSVTLADSGTYKCDVNYNDGTPPATNETLMTVYSLWTVTLEVTETQDGKSKTTLQSNINDSSVHYTWNSEPGGSSYTVTKNGDYTLCISGGRADCLSPSSKKCITYTVTSIDVCPIMVYAVVPGTVIELIGCILVIVLAFCFDKDGKLKEGSLKGKCDCCPPKNKFCRIVCPLWTKPFCTGSDEGCCSGLSTTVKNIISVHVFTILAAVIGVIIAFGLGLNSGKCILALILSIVCGLLLLAIFIVSVYPHWPCLPERGENGGNCFRTCRISTVEEPNRPAGNQDLPNRNTSRSPQASASEVHFTTEGRSPRPLPAIGSEAKQLPPISYEESTLKKKPLNATLPEIPKSNKLPPVDTVNNEEDKPKKRRKRKKKKEGEENEEEDKRDSQNSGGQANVEEED